GLSPAFIPARKIPGLTPRTLAFVCAAISPSRRGPGERGLPSKQTVVAPTSSAEATRFHIIQFVFVYQKKRSPGRRSSCSQSRRRWSTTTPPWLCTMPLGIPVVPEEYSTHSGVSKSTRTNSGGVSPEVTLFQEAKSVL